MKDNKILIAYFSCSGVTARVAKTLAEATGADLYRIEPETPYSDADLNWNNPQSRSSVEMKDKSSRPAIGGSAPALSDYDTVFVGFPIWWYVAPTIVNTFLESHDFTGKTIVPFATSGSSGLGETEQFLRTGAPAANWIPGKLLGSRFSREEAARWVSGLNLGTAASE